MPTVFRIDDFRVAIYPNDHRPAHVHVVGPRGEAVFELNCPDGPVRLRERFRLTHRDVNAIAARLTRQLSALCRDWEKMHGQQ